VLGVGDAHEACSIDDRPRLIALDRRLYRLRIGDIEVAALGEHEREAAMLAQPGEGPAQCAGRAGDENRPPAGEVHGRRSADVEALRAAPPAGNVEDGVVELGPLADRLGSAGDQGRPRCRTADVECADVVDVVAARDQGAPVHRAEQRPQGHRSQIDTLGTHLLGRLPHLDEPTQLLVARAAVMDLGDHHRGAVALPGLAQPRRRTDVAGEMRHADRLEVEVAVAAISAGLVARIEIKPLVEIALAGQIMVDADDVGRGAAVEEARQLVFGDAAALQDAMPFVTGTDATGEQVEAEPAPLVLVARLVSELLRREGLAEVFGLEELGGRVGAPDCRHRLGGAQTFVDQRARHLLEAALVRIPVAVEARETRRGERLVDRGPPFDPRIAFRHARGIVAEQLWKCRIGQAGVARARPVMNEATDDGNAKLAQPRQPNVVPREVELVGPVGRHRFPDDGIAHRLDPQSGDRVQVVEPGVMPGLDDLVPEVVADANDRAFNPAPELQRFQGLGHARLLLLVTRPRRCAPSASR
jgi:hypothetical protein